MLEGEYVKCIYTLYVSTLIAQRTAKDILINLKLVALLIHTLIKSIVKLITASKLLIKLAQLVT